MKSSSFVQLLLILACFQSEHYSKSGYRLIGFQNSQYFEEQVLDIAFEPEIKIHLNAPSAREFDPGKPVCLAIYALPNGNTTGQTIGKQMQPGDDWHFDIQHIGAQTRFIRNNISEYNLVTVYLENDLKSWPAWKSKYADHANLVNGIMDSIRYIFREFENFVVLTGHSGGGRFTFSFIDGNEDIPDFVKRISFLDSNYGYNHSYGQKLISWLNRGEDKYLSVLAYNDSIALYNGEPIVSDTGGTWVRSKMMREFMSDYYAFDTSENQEMIISEALDSRVQVILKKNPERKILHTVQVELNGFIQGMLSGTGYEGVNYEYYGERAYSDLIQREFTGIEPLDIPPRPPDAMTGSEFMQSVTNLSFEQREERILEEITKGNIPEFLRTLTSVSAEYSDAAGLSHSVVFEVMPDYLAIGSDEDFCRIPMGPITAQKLADIFGASMPTRKLVDKIYVESEVKLAPVTFNPNVYQIDSVPIFIEHNSAIEEQRRDANALLGQLVGGIKKDVVISNKITDPNRTHHVTIYGWHQLNGNPIQPLYNGHIDVYTDYSHGIRLINKQILVDSSVVEYEDILTDDILYKILSDESGPMERASYLKVSGLPEKPNSFGLLNIGPNELQLVNNPEEDVDSYDCYLSTDGNNFNYYGSLPRDDLFIRGLEENTLYFVKFKSVNEAGESGYSEVLASVTANSSAAETIIINGFDRSTDGNTRDFTRQHGSALYFNGIHFHSATNEAMTDGLIDLIDYAIVIYILGEESTADESFSTAEQSIVKDYLINGGNLFVSGSEIAWDLDHRGSSADKSFIHNFLKMKYIADAPYNQSSTHYHAKLIQNGPIEDIPPFYFDNGSKGTYNVKWPDVVKETSGGTDYIKYSSLDEASGSAGVVYQGLFPDGVLPGKIVTLGFPFETIYPEDIRNIFMTRVLDYFNSATGFKENEDLQLPSEFRLYQNYPNPFNPTTTIKYSIPASDRGVSGSQTKYHVKLVITDIQGSEVSLLVNEAKPAGNYTVLFDGSTLSSGIYFYSLITSDFMEVKKMILLK